MSPGGQSTSVTLSGRRHQSQRIYCRRSSERLHAGDRVGLGRQLHGSPTLDVPEPQRQQHHAIRSSSRRPPMGTRSCCHSLNSTRHSVAILTTCCCPPKTNGGFPPMGRADDLSNGQCAWPLGIEPGRDRGGDRPGAGSLLPAAARRSRPGPSGGVGRAERLACSRHRLSDWTASGIVCHRRPMASELSDSDTDLRPGEVAVALPAQTDAGVYFIGIIHTPWTHAPSAPNAAARTGRSAPSSLTNAGGQR